MNNHASHSVCMYVCKNLCMHICIYVGMYVIMYVCMRLGSLFLCICLSVCLSLFSLYACNDLSRGLMNLSSKPINFVKFCFLFAYLALLS